MWYLNYILNQKGCPAFFADTLANRPAAGYIGRLFISTDTYEIYRDTGSAWDVIGGPGSGTITGTLTENRVAYATGANTIATSANLLFNGTTLTALNNIVVSGIDIGETGNNNLLFGTLNYTSLTTGFDNIAIGLATLRNATLATQNIAIGSTAMNFATTGSYNIAIGYASLRDGTGEMNVSVGHTAMFLASGSRNTAVGYESLRSSSASNENTAIGYRAINSLQVSNGKNTGVGYNVLYAVSTGENNTAIGHDAGYYITGLSPLQTNTNSVFLGSSTRASANGNTNEIVVGYNVDGNGSNTVTIGNTSIVNNYFSGNVRASQFTKGTPTDTTRAFAAAGNGNEISLILEEYGGGSAVPEVFFFKGRGSITAKSNVLLGDELGGLAVGGYVNGSLNVSGGINFPVVNVNTVDNYADSDMTIALTNNSAVITEKFRFQSIGNFIVNTTAAAWSGRTAIQIAGDSYIVSSNTNIIFGANVFFNGAARSYIINDFATSYRHSSGQHQFEVAVSGVAGAAISFTRVMTMTQAANVLIATTTDDLVNKLQVNGGALVTQMTTANPAGGTAAPWKLGSYVVASAVQTGYIEVDINGTLYKVLAST